MQRLPEPRRPFLFYDTMTLTIEIPDHKQAFVTELLQSLSYVRFTTKTAKARKQDTTDYLLSDPTNARELRESIAQARRGEIVRHDLLPAE